MKKLGSILMLLLSWSLIFAASPSDNDVGKAKTETSIFYTDVSNFADLTEIRQVTAPTVVICYEFTVNGFVVCVDLITPIACNAEIPAKKAESLPGFYTYEKNPAEHYSCNAKLQALKHWPQKTA